MSFFTSAQNLIHSGLDLLFPPACVHCKAPNVWLCQNCKSGIFFITSIVCPRCGTPASSPACTQCSTNRLHYIDGIRSAAVFEDNPMRSAVHHLKYQGRKVLASSLAEMLAETYRYYNLNADVIIPVPLHRTRLKERGYNQSTLLAKKLGRLVGLPVDTTTLYRTRDTGQQMALKAQQRRHNVAGAFACRGHLSGLKFLLVDDVCTTGSTLDACAMSLKMNGADAVWGLTLAKAT